MILGIVGLGYVGGALLNGMQKSHHIETYDLKEECSCDSLESLCELVDVVFVCVPTPMRHNGLCDTSIVESVLQVVNESSCNIAVIKSTTPPGTTEFLNTKFKNLDVVFSPEFLTESNYLNDFIDSNRIIVGGPRPSTTIVKNIFRQRFPKKKIIKTHSTIAEMVKYLTNSFLALKVSYANEIKEMCDCLNIDYDKVIEYSLSDSRLGDSHWSVPGPDGKNGFGGTCFPKDLKALISLATILGVEPVILRAAWEKNLQVRPDRDWELLVGRAITKENNNE